jgi:hypothetical protein
MQRVAVQFAPRGTQRFRTLRSVPLTDPHGYFEVRVRFPSSGLVRLAWRHGGVAVSRTEAIKEP